jgi:hypothetical protein
MNYSSLLIGLLLTGILGACATVAPITPTVSAGDPRVVLDRLHPKLNAHHEDFADLNAVGVLAPLDVGAQRVRGFGSGGLIDACHVLTAQHVGYGWAGDFESPPPLGQAVEFMVGQTEPAEHNKTEGLKFVRFGTVTAYGGSAQHHDASDSPELDWAVVTLSENVPGVKALELLGLNPPDKGSNWARDQDDNVGVAGFPGDHRDPVPVRSHIALWGSFGKVLGVYYNPDSGYAYFTASVAGTPGASGGIAFARHDNHYVAVGILQGRGGDGIHDLDTKPSVGVLLTPKLLKAIRAAQLETPCTAS